MSVDDLPEWTVAVWWLSAWDDEWWYQEEERTRALQKGVKKVWAEKGWMN